MRNETSLIQIIKKNPLAWIVQAVGILVLILNLWLAYKLSPISQGVENNNTRIRAIELEQEKNASNHEDIAVIKEQVLHLRQDVQEIKDASVKIMNLLR